MPLGCGIEGAHNLHSSGLVLEVTDCTAHPQSRPIENTPMITLHYSDGISASRHIAKAISPYFVLRPKEVFVKPTIRAKRHTGETQPKEPPVHYWDRGRLHVTR